MTLRGGGGGLSLHVGNQEHDKLLVEISFYKAVIYERFASIIIISRMILVSSAHIPLSYDYIPAFQTAPLRTLCPEASTNLELVEADLTKPDTWLSAVAGIREVYHVASPLPVGTPKHDSEIIKPAVDGTLNVLEACRASGNVRKVVITGSCAAVWNHNPKQPGKLSAEDWADTKAGSAYDRSKLFAEQAAWDFMKKLPRNEKFELCVLNPGAIVGPLLYKSECASATLMKDLLERNNPVIVKVSIFSVDVRDLAVMHINAMAQDGTTGKRHICVTNQVWCKEMAETLVKTFGPMGYNVPTTVLPKFLVSFLSHFDATLRLISAYVGVDLKFDQSLCRNILGSDPIEFEQTMKDMGHSLIDLGVVKKTAKYKPQ